MKRIFLKRTALHFSKLFFGTTLVSLFFIGNALAVVPQKITYKMSQLQKSQKRWLEINLTTQKLTAWQGNQQVFNTNVSTGKPSTPTLDGLFAIESKQLVGRMRGNDYDVANVPYIMYYYKDYAVHGAYWHNQFGTAVSRGCINVAIFDAKRLFEWTAIKTAVVIHR